MSARTQGVSFSDELLEAAKQRARSDGRSFSNYVRTLIRRDLNLSGGREMEHAHKPSRKRNRKHPGELAD